MHRNVMALPTKVSARFRFQYANRLANDELDLSGYPFFNDRDSLNTFRDLITDLPTAFSWDRPDHPCNWTHKQEKQKACVMRTARQAWLTEACFETNYAAGFTQVELFTNQVKATVHAVFLTRCLIITASVTGATPPTQGKPENKRSGLGLCYPDNSSNSTTASVTYASEILHSDYVTLERNARVRLGFSPSLGYKLSDRMMEGRHSFSPDTPFVVDGSMSEDEARAWQFYFARTRQILIQPRHVSLLYKDGTSLNLWLFKDVMPDFIALRNVDPVLFTEICREAAEQTRLFFEDSVKVLESLHTVSRGVSGETAVLWADATNEEVLTILKGIDPLVVLDSYLTKQDPRPFDLRFWENGGTFSVSTIANHIERIPQEVRDDKEWESVAHDIENFDHRVFSLCMFLLRRNRNLIVRDVFGVLSPNDDFIFETTFCSAVLWLRPQTGKLEWVAIQHGVRSGDRDTSILAREISIGCGLFSASAMGNDPFEFCFGGLDSFVFTEGDDGETFFRGARRQRRDEYFKGRASCNMREEAEGSNHILKVFRFKNASGDWVASINPLRALGRKYGVDWGYKSWTHYLLSVWSTAIRIDDSAGDKGIFVELCLRPILAVLAGELKSGLEFRPHQTFVTDIIGDGNTDWFTLDTYFQRSAPNVPSVFENDWATEFPGAPPDLIAETILKDSEGLGELMKMVEDGSLPPYFLDIIETAQRTGSTDPTTAGLARGQSAWFSHGFGNDYLEVFSS